jgi:hypothetical protein
VTSNGTVDTTLNNQVTVNVPNTYSSSDEGKVVSNGGLVSQTSKNVTSNGTVDTTLNNHVVVNVAPNVGSKTVTENGTYNASSDNYDGYSQIIVNVTGEGESSGEDEEIARSIVERTIILYSNSKVQIIGNYAFYSCSLLSSVNFPACTAITFHAFEFCRALSSVNFPACTAIAAYAFGYCRALSSANFPVCSTIGNYAFTYCSDLSYANFPVCSTIGNNAFSECHKLLSLYIRLSSVCVLANSNAFNHTPIAGYTTSTEGVYGSIYVPASLLSDYKAANNWSYFSSRFVGI